LKSSYQRRIEQIKNFLSEKLPQDQERASKIELNKRVEKADNFSDLMDIDTEFNKDEGTAMQMKYGSQYKFGGSLPQHGLLGNIGQGAGQVLNNVGSAVGNAVGNAATTAGNAVSNVGGAIGDNAVGNVVSGVGSGITNAGVATGDIISGTTGQFGDGEGFGTNMLQAGQSAFNTGQEYLQNADFNPLAEGQQNPFAQDDTSGGSANVNHLWGQGNLNAQPGGGMKMVHDAFYRYGGKLPQHAYDWNVGSGNYVAPDPTGGMSTVNPNGDTVVTPGAEPERANWENAANQGLGFLGNLFKGTGNGVGQAAENMGEISPMLYNAMVMNQPSSYMWNPIGYNPNENYLYDILNQQEGDTAMARQNLLTPQYWDPSGALKEVDTGYDNMKDSLDYYSDAGAGINAQMLMDANQIDDRMGVVKDYAERNMAESGPKAAAQAYASASNLYDPIFGKLQQLGSERANADLMAWDWNNKVDSARNLLGKQLVEDTSEYAQGRGRDRMLGNALDMGGAFYGYDPYQGIMFNDQMG